MNRIDWKGREEVLFCTLTYPDSVSERDYKRRSMDRYLWHRFVEKYLNAMIPTIWRVEWKPRLTGSRKGRVEPHWHLLLLTREFLPHDKVREWWRKSIGYGDGPLSTDIRRVSGTEGAIRYVAKYTAKCTSLDIVTYHNNLAISGRHWGVLRRSLIPLAEQVIYTSLELGQIKDLQAYARSRSSRYDEFGAAGFTAFGKDAVKIVKEILK
jgi:hypothetical protein